METIVVKPTSRDKLEALKAFLTALKIDFTTVNGTGADTAEPGSDVVKEIERPYNPEFVAKIKKGDEDYKAGRYKTIKPEDLWK
jgi:hypothetical protein